MPRALELEEIPGIVNDFRQAIANAREAAFDLVELHSAHGYLLHQFLSLLQTIVPNQYGGSVENRARLVLEVVDAGLKNGVPIALAFAFPKSVLSRTQITARMKKPMHCI